MPEWLDWNAARPELAVLDSAGLLRFHDVRRPGKPLSSRKTDCEARLPVAGHTQCTSMSVISSKQRSAGSPACQYGCLLLECLGACCSCNKIEAMLCNAYQSSSLW